MESDTFTQPSDLALLTDTFRDRATSLRREATDLNPVVATAYRRRAAELELAAAVGRAALGLVDSPVEVREPARAGFRAA